MQWTMHDSKKFTAEKGGFSVVLIISDKFYPQWEIYKDGVLVDRAYRHPPVTTKFNKELAGKVQAERYLDKLIKQQPNE